MVFCNLCTAGLWALLELDSCVQTEQLLMLGMSSYQLANQHHQLLMAIMAINMMMDMKTTLCSEAEKKALKIIL